jgi:nitrogen regulatory protein P-II 1
MADKYTKIEIIAHPYKFEELKEALNAIGVTGMTVTQVSGCGMQKGHMEYYRGVSIDTNMYPNVKVEVVVCLVPVELVIDTVRKVLYTGELGDGMVFVYNLENVIRVRTGEEGKAALQDNL